MLFRSMGPCLLATLSSISPFFNHPVLGPLYSVLPTNQWPISARAGGVTGCGGGYTLFNHHHFLTQSPPRLHCHQPIPADSLSTTVHGDPLTPESLTRAGPWTVKGIEPTHPKVPPRNSLDSVLPWPRRGCYRMWWWAFPHHGPLYHCFYMLVK